MIDVSNGPVLMGIVNVTPDSFSDGGKFIDPELAIDHAMKMMDEGAAILDIGGESTRPGSAPVSPHEEMDRVIPVIEGLVGCNAVISVDTRHAATMKAAIKAGATMVNDVSALTHDPDSVKVVAEGLGISVCLMHMQGDPKTMQAAPHYDNVVQEVFDYLAARIAVCEASGIARDRIVIDPGIGFGKTLEHNIKLLRSLDKFQSLGVPVLLGVSRKSFIEKIIPGTAADQRLPGSLAAALYGFSKRAQIFRVHDVAETRQAFAVFSEISQTR
jgi:dihydropteroate synthase